MSTDAMPEQDAEPRAVELSYCSDRCESRRGAPTQCRGGGGITASSRWPRAAFGATSLPAAPPCYL
jgi:hypothetical protein